MKIHKLWPLPLLALTLALGGCGGSGLVNVKGRLTYKGQPVPSTYVLFCPEDGKRMSRGMTDDDGYFILANSRDDMGAFVGRHTVVLKYHVSAEEETHKIEPKASTELREIIARYADQHTSTLKYEITGSGQTVDIKLE
jgi:hypothetical protein